MKSFPNRYIKWLILGLGCLLYAQTITYEYALDDKIVITHNQFTKQGWAGIDDLLTTGSFTGFYGKQKKLVAGGRYRPLSMITFAAEYGLFGEAPAVSHLLNTLFYAFTGLLLFLILQQLFPAKVKWWWLSLPFVTALLYVSHPIHTEVVSNIKGRDGLLSLLGALGALYYSIRFTDTEQWKYMGAAAACLLLGVFSKETALTFVVVIPVTLYFFRKTDWRQLGIVFGLLWIPALLYLAARFAVLGAPDLQGTQQLMNNPFVHATTSEKYATILYTWGLYLKKLIFPHPLTHDYYPKQIPLLNWFDWRVLMSLAVWLGLLIYAFNGLKKRSLPAYSILFFLLTFSVVSNLVFPVGTFMNERFMYFPSIGFCMIIGYLVSDQLRARFRQENSYRVVATLLLGIVVVGYSFKTVTRNTAWQNDFTLATTDVKISGNSAKAHMGAAEAYINRAADQPESPQKRNMLQQALNHLAVSLNLHPAFFPPRPLSARAYYHLGQYAKSIEWYDYALQMKPRHKNSLQSLEHIGQRMFKEKQYDLSANAYHTLLAYTRDSVRIYAKLGKVYGKGKGDFQTALEYLHKAYRLDPTDTDILQKMGVVYAMQGLYEQALKYFKEALEVAPENAHILMNVGLTYQNLGQKEKGQQYLQKAFEIDPSLQQR